MPKIEELFIPHTAKSSGFNSYDAGKVAFVTNGFRQNGVLGFVKPKPTDRVFNSIGIVISAFCEATVQIPPFVARGNGGSGLIVLEPKQATTPAELGYVAAYINKVIRWRFSWSRQASVERIRRLEIPNPSPSPVQFRVRELLPSISQVSKQRWRVNFKPFCLNSIYELVAGDYHSAANLPSGDIPLVSCGDANDGIMAFVTVPENRIYDHKLTIAFNGMNTLTTKYHPYRFAAKDDVALCTPRTPLRLSTEVFIQMMMNRERWRYSYYRKCYMDKLKRFAVPLPAKDGKIDEDTIQIALESNPYWQYLKPRLQA